MASSRTVVRDFIYLDTDKLHSLYSQVFEGVVDQIVESFANEEARVSGQKGRPFEGKTLDSRVAEVSVRTQNMVLHDHMYHRLEQRIGESFVSGNNISAENLRESLAKSFLVTATGSAEIEDFARMEVFLSKFNELAEAIAYSQAIGTVADALRGKQAEIAEIKDRNQKRKAEEEARKLNPGALAKKIAVAQGLTQDEKMLSNFKLLTSVFHGSAYEVTIVPTDASNGVAFRGVLDKRWLRVAPELLNALYGGFVAANWTIVGEVTHLPGESLPQFAPGTQPQPEKAADLGELSPSMRDPYRAMIRSARVFERMFLESQQRLEVVVSPLALYRAMEVTVSSA